jgi:hypothetical protein
MVRHEAVRENCHVVGLRESQQALDAQARERVADEYPGTPVDAGRVEHADEAAIAVGMQAGRTMGHVICQATVGPRARGHPGR